MALFASAPAVAFIAPVAAPVAAPAAPATSARGALDSSRQGQWSPSLALPVAVGAAALAGGRSKKVRATRAATRAGGKAIPFLPEPQYWQWAKGMPGDSGFDPLNLWNHSDKDAFSAPGQDMRDAEIKHCRLAMLAAAHWPMAELYHPQIAAALGMPSKLSATGLNPSLVNGGLNDPFLQGFLGVAVLVAAITDLSKAPNTEAGDFGFDPLSLRNAEPPVLPSLFKLGAGRTWMAESEIKHGRLAMIAIAAFAVQEKISQVPILLETPFGTA